MTKQTNSRQAHDDLSSLAAEAKELLVSTAGVAGEKVAAARERMTAALEEVRDKTVKTAKAVDVAVHENPYKSIAIGVAVGAIIGYVLARRGRNDE